MLWCDAARGVAVMVLLRIVSLHAATQRVAGAVLLCVVS